MRQILFVMGMHRSGTSATTGLLAHLGLWPGRQEDLLPPNDFNPNGYWEHRDVVELNDAALVRTGGWASPGPLRPIRGLTGALLSARREKVLRHMALGARPGQPLVVKDPRLCRLLPGWIEDARCAGLEPSVLVMQRDRAAVAHSLVRREGWDAERAYTLIDTYLHDLDEALAGVDYRHFRLAFEDVLRDWRAALGPPGGALSWLLPKHRPTPDQDDEADAFLRGGRRSA